jgi:hypothetical protein
MAVRFTPHNKFHAANHHTLSSSRIVDSALDPIASFEHPFLGIFYNRLTDERRTYTHDTNSYLWWSAYTTIQTFSSNWMPDLSLWTTVNSLSDEWNLGYNSYLNLKTLSSRWESVYTTVNTYSAEWGSPFLMLTNVVQEYTVAKTFSGQTLGLATVSTFDWNLDIQQVAFINVDRDIFINNPDEESIINGGLYTLIIRQYNDGVFPGGNKVEFDTNYRFNDRGRIKNIISQGLSAMTIINFLAVDGILFGDVTMLSGLPLQTIPGPEPDPPEEDIFIGTII